MGNCTGNQPNEPTCFICEQVISNMRYLRCVSCQQAVHIKCLYKHSDTMNTCTRCGHGNLNIINLEEHKESIWSRSSILTQNSSLASSKKKRRNKNHCRNTM